MQKTLLLLAYLLTASAALAQTLPGPADVNRVIPRPDRLPSSDVTGEMPLRYDKPGNISAPEGMDEVPLTIREIKLEGNTVLSKKVLKAIYAPYLNKETHLAALWEIAAKITRAYRERQYFISRAYVPEQEIIDGIVTIRVVEGYVGNVVADDTLRKLPIVQSLIGNLMAQKPLTAAQLESLMLHLNDLPDAGFYAALQPLPDAPEGAVELVLEHREKRGTGLVSADNFGSRFLGPYQGLFTYSDRLFSQQRTTVSVLSSVQKDELRYYALRHEAFFAPEWRAEVTGSYVIAQPGSSLAINDINSDSESLGLAVIYQPIRQYLENLTFSAQLDGRNTNTDILGDVPLVRDRVRVLRGMVEYDRMDDWQGHNYASFTLNRGLEIFGASKQDEMDLSRSEGRADFTTMQFALSRQQLLGQNFSLVNQVAGQWASDPLLASEEFGLGGQVFGRAYDVSEVMGDHGLATSLELRYRGLVPWNELTLTPFAFYDIGKVWNKDSDGRSFSASSVGLGMRMNYATEFSGQFGLAFPLTREAEHPIYGDGKSPRILFQLNYGF
jgi:hemolysin activation/secretion protein